MSETVCENPYQWKIWTKDSDVCEIINLFYNSIDDFRNNTEITKFPENKKKIFLSDFLL